MNKKNTKNAVLLSGVTLGLLGLAGCGHTPPAVETPILEGTAPFSKETIPVVPTSVNILPATSAASNYKDGKYTVIGTYKSPAGPEEIGVTLVLANNIITESNVEVRATAPKSLKLQKEFSDNYKTLVVGKSIESLNLGKVVGSSLTPIGFNDALAKIKAEAK